MFFFFFVNRWKSCSFAIKTVLDPKKDEELIKLMNSIIELCMEKFMNHPDKKINSYTSN